MTTSFPGIRFLYDNFIISQEHLKRFICQRHCVYFTTLGATVHYKKRSVIDSRKIEGYVYLRKTIVACSFKGAYLFHRTSCIDFCLKSTVEIVTGKLLPVKLPLERLPPTNHHWIRVTVGARVRVGRQSYGGQFSRGQFSMCRVKCTKAPAEFPFFHSECVNLTISHQQLQLFINFGKFSRRAIVNICTCEGDLRKSYCLQRASLSEQS